MKKTKRLAVFLFNFGSGFEVEKILKKVRFYQISGAVGKLIPISWT